MDETIHVETDGTTRPDGISESEHEAIVGAVNALLTDRAKPPEAMPRDRSRRSGAAMAVFTNLVILLALAGAVYAYITFVPRSAPDVNLFSGQVATTESAILTEVREQTERRLSEREAEIARIERELNALRSARSDADPSAGSSQRESELLAELDSLNASGSRRSKAIGTESASSPTSSPASTTASSRRSARRTTTGPAPSSTTQGR
jgi:Skp family chaperone for outer membrane proteins